jgi:hypothetical protein
MSTSRLVSFGFELDKDELDEDELNELAEDEVNDDNDDDDDDIAINKETKFIFQSLIFESFI